MRLLTNEARLFFRGKLPLLGIAAVLGFSVYGVFSLSGADPFSMRYMNLSATLSAMGTARIAAIACALAVALNALLYLSKDRRSNAEPLTLSATGGRQLTLARNMVLLLYSLLLCAVYAAAVAVTWQAAGLDFDAAALVFTAFAVVLPAALCALLLCAGLYLLTDSLDVGFLGFGAFFFVSLLSRDYRMQWIGTHVSWFSDFAGFSMHIPSILYGRLLALTGFGAFFAAGLLAMRHHGLGFAASVRRQPAKIPLAACALLLAAVCVGGAIGEPFLDRYSPLMARAELSAFGTSEDMDTGAALGDVRVTEVVSDVMIDSSSISGKVAYRIAAQDEARRIAFLLNGGLSVKRAAIGDREITFTQGEGKVWIDLPAGEETLSLEYGGHMKTPVMGSYPCLIGEDSVYLQEGSYWLPQPEELAAGNVTITGSVTLPSGLTLATPGRLTEKTQQGSNTLWRYEAQAFSLDAALYAGRYEISSFDVDGVPVEVYHSAKHAEAMRHFGLEDEIAAIVAYYQKKLGPYPFDAPLKVVETSLYKTGGHSSLNIVTAAETAFNMLPTDASGETLASFAYLNAVDLIAHEIAHQWWGSGAQIAGEAPWSSEGLAQLMANAYLADAFSQETADSMGLYAWLSSVTELRNGYFSSEEKLEKLSAAKRAEKEMELTSASLYYEMPLLLLDMRRQLGENAFWDGIARVYQERCAQAITYQEFCEKMGIEEGAVSVEHLYDNIGL